MEGRDKGVEGDGLGWERKNSFSQNASNKCKRMTELESHCFVTPQNHQCTLKPLGERFFRNKILLMSKYHPTDYLAMQRGKCVFKMERSPP